MKIQVPTFAEGITDQGVLTFLAFCFRVCEIYGYDSQYYIDTDDASNLCNKSQQGIENWLRSFPQIAENMRIGKPLNHTIAFTLPQRPRQGQRLKCSIETNLTDPRQQMIWSYILGCFNHNLITDGNKKKTRADVHDGNSHNIQHMKEFRLTRVVGEKIPNIFVDEFFETIDEQD
jgi:hypothetical protein